MVSVKFELMSEAANCSLTPESTSAFKMCDHMCSIMVDADASIYRTPEFIAEKWLRL